MASKKPLVNDAVLRQQLALLETQGADLQAAIETATVELPPTSARRLPEVTPMSDGEIERLRSLVKAHGIELIDDGACYRAKRQRDFMYWTLMASPLQPAGRGGGEGNALLEIVRRFCEPPES
jgi:hypothetical protein